MQGPEWLARDRDALTDVLGHTAKLARRYLAELDEAPVIPATPPPSKTVLGNPRGAAAAVNQFASEWLPTMVASAGPRFQGYVTGGATPAAIAGDWLASALDQNV